MAAYQLLNNVAHKDLKINTAHKKEFGDAVGGCLVFPSEFLTLQREYPILLQKDTDSGLFQIIALFGFQNSENVFLTDNGWDARYVPLLMRKDPFLIGFQKDPENPAKEQPVIHIDMEHPRVVDGAQGAPLFLEAGGVSALLEDVKKNLLAIHQGLTEAKILTDLLLEHQLIENFELDVQFDDDTRLKTKNYYTINTKKLYELPEGLLFQMHQKGYLQLIYLMNFSFGNIKNLLARKNKEILAKP